MFTHFCSCLLISVHVYLFFSQIRTYNETADSTLPNVPTKRKFNDEDEEKTPHKTPKIEPISEPELGKLFVCGWGEGWM